MGKIVSVSEFKANCLKLIDALQRDGEPLTITKRGKVVAEVVPKTGDPVSSLPSVFGMLKSDRYRFDMDPSEPACDPEDWEALR